LAIERLGGLGFADSGVQCGEATKGVVDATVEIARDLLRGRCDARRATIEKIALTRARLVEVDARLHARVRKKRQNDSFAREPKIADAPDRVVILFR